MYTRMVLLWKLHCDQKLTYGEISSGMLTQHILNVLSAKREKGARLGGSASAACLFWYRSHLLNGHSSVTLFGLALLCGSSWQNILEAVPQMERSEACVRVLTLIKFGK